MKVINKNKKIRNKIFLLVVSLFVFFPLFTIIMTSFKPFSDILTNPTSLFPSKWCFENYYTIFKEFPFLRYGFNSVLVTIVSCIGTIFSASLVAYGFSSFKIKGKEIIFFIMLSTIFIPSQVLQIPLFELYRKLGWFNTYYPLIIPSWLGGGIVNVFLIRNFFESIPKSIYEAGNIDGASSFCIFIKIVIPIAKPIILTVAIFAFVGSWNDFFSPLLYINNDEMYTLAFGLYITFSKFEVAGNTAWNLIAASDLVVILPIIILYFIFQKYFVEGITFGSVKE